jgi:uncharacterized protein YegL
MGNQISGFVEKVQGYADTEQLQQTSPASSRDSSPCSSPRNAILSQVHSLPRSYRNRRVSFNRGIHRNHFAAADHDFKDDDGIQDAKVEQHSEPEGEVLSSGPLTISTRLEYTSLKKDEMHNVFGLVSLQAAEAAMELESSTNDADHTPVDVVCVLDISASMTGAKIQLVKDAVAFVVSEMQPTDRLSLVSFNHGAQRCTSLKKMNSGGKDVSQQALMQLYANGGTSIAAGLDCGIAVMEQRRQRNPVGAVFLLTDGQDSTSKDQIHQLVARARTAHCSVYAFGFGEDHDTTTLNTISESAQTPFTYVEKLDSIRNVFAGAVNGLMSVAAQGIELKIAPEDGCTVTAVHTPFTQTSADDGSVVVHIPDAFEGERRDVVIELRVPAASVDGSVALLRASAKYRAVREQATVQTPECCLHTNITAEPEGEPDAEVVQQRQRIEVTGALENAIAQVEKGHFDKAQEVLSERAKSLRQSKAQNDISRALLAEVEDAQDRLKDEQAWRHGGKAEVTNAMNIHRQQRCTTTAESVSRHQKCSKSLYVNSRQKAGISRSSW